MNQFLSYFRQHPWQRRALTFLVSLVIALVAAVTLWPVIDDHLLIRRLGDESDWLRERAVREAATQIRQSPATLRRLQRALRTTDDRRFYGVASALNRVSEFYTPQREGGDIDRLAAMRFEATEHAPSRWMVLHRQCLSDRDNLHMRRLLAAAIGDANAGIRELATVLAFKVRDDAAIRSLLADKAPAVRAAAAQTAALAGRTDLTGEIAPLLDDADPMVVASAGYALASLDPDAHSAAICGKLVATESAEARDRLLAAAILLNDDNARQAVRECFDKTVGGDSFADAMLLTAIASLQVDWAEQAVRPILTEAGGPQGEQTTSIQLHAALRAADTLDLPVRHEVREIITKLWGPSLQRTMGAAAMVLGRQIDLDQGRRSAPTGPECIRTLQQAAIWQSTTDDPTDDQPPTIWTTPVASAAAAVALWRLNAPLADQFLRSSAASPESLPGDTIAWALAMSDRPGEGYAVGGAMLPAPGAPPAARVYNDDERASGAMLLALAARTDEQKAAAAERIRQRLEGTGLGGEDNPYVQLTYRCALLILGRREHGDDLYDLMGVLAFPQRRVLTALLSAGDKRALDWMLWNTQQTPDDVVELLVGRGLQDVLAVVAPQLPRVDPAAPHDVRVWQARMLSDTYAIHHAAIQLKDLP
ncbi:hypothetical protein LCGC14_0868240 [marine sediment metagenome]|uniref:HEAT repeat domain-containing protein n=1 Tax=marine sediment metagenome TaxID=412755 RepID=A0A0F9PR19_9ZZZZ|nr:hypothetical protein [Phycisphaerae bacterium]